MVLSAIRRQRVPLQRIRPALDRLCETFGIGHALASRRLYTDGAEVLSDDAEHRGGATARAVRDLVVVRNGQHVFAEVVDCYLHGITFGDDDYASVITLPRCCYAGVVTDPRRSYGRSIFRKGGAKVRDALERFWAADDSDAVALEFGVPPDEFEDAIRVASRPAA